MKHHFTSTNETSKVDWNSKRLARYLRWRAQTGYHDLRRRTGLAYARIAKWQPTRDPDFLGIGAPRTASTWLYQRLSQHPDVCLPARKEIHFFDAEPAQGTYTYGPDAAKPILRPMDLDDPASWRWYRAHFGRCVGKVTGEISPAYAMLPTDRIQLVKQHFPNVKLIFTMRNPISRAWSSVRKELWLRFGMQPHEVPETDALLQIAMRPGVLARGDYKSAIERWESQFKGQILYLFYDDIKQDPRAELQKVCRFLSIDASDLEPESSLSKRVNDMPASDIPERVRIELQRYYEPQLPFLAEKFGRSFQHWTDDTADARA